ncbi:MAG: trypsin-like serine peptidase [Agriterribacter sp.]
MVKTIFFSMMLAFASEAYSQIECGCCYDSAKFKRVDVIGEQLRERPFTAIVGLTVNEKFRGTGSFISDYTLVTGKHNLFENKKAKNLSLLINTSEGNVVVALQKKDFKIVPFGKKTEFSAKDDIALIIIKNRSKLSNLKYTRLFLEDYQALENKINASVHITGYPCDKEANPASTMERDTLTDKFVLGKEHLVFNSDSTIAGMDVCACAGDSGSPLWVNVAGINYVIGVCHGISNTINADQFLRVSCLLTGDKVRKIKQLINKHKG